MHYMDAMGMVCSIIIKKKNDNESMKSKKTLNFPQKGFEFVELHQTTAIYLFFCIEKKTKQMTSGPIQDEGKDVDVIFIHDP